MCSSGAGAQHFLPACRARRGALQALPLHLLLQPPCCSRSLLLRRGVACSTCRAPSKAAFSSSCRSGGAESGANPAPGRAAHPHWARGQGGSRGPSTGPEAIRPLGRRRRPAGASFPSDHKGEDRRSQRQNKTEEQRRPGRGGLGLSWAWDAWGSLEDRGQGVRQEGPRAQCTWATTRFRASLSCARPSFRASLDNIKASR